MTSSEIDQAITERGSCAVALDGVHVDITRTGNRYAYAFTWRGEAYGDDNKASPLAAQYAARQALAAIREDERIATY